MFKKVFVKDIMQDNNLLTHNQGENIMEQNQSTKLLVSQSTALHLCFWLGYFGVHNFYSGKKQRGAIQLVSALIFPIVTLVIMLMDLYAIIKGTYVDGQNRGLELNASALLKKIYGLFYPVMVGLTILAIIAAIVVPKLMG